jgi:hypothetical protein
MRHGTSCAAQSTADSKKHALTYRGPTLPIQSATSSHKIFQICIQQADRMQLHQERHDFFAQTQDGAVLTVLGTANALPIGKAG